MRLRDIPDFMVIVGFATGTVLLIVGQATAAWIVWAFAALVHWFGERITDYLTSGNPIARRRRKLGQAREAEDREIWRRATEWERGRVEREGHAEAELNVAKLKQDNLRTRTDYDFD